MVRVPRAHPRCGTRCALGVCGGSLAPLRFSRRSGGVPVCMWGRRQPQAAPLPQRGAAALLTSPAAPHRRPLYPCARRLLGLRDVSVRTYEIPPVADG